MNESASTALRPRARSALRICAFGALALCAAASAQQPAAPEPAPAPPPGAPAEAATHAAAPETSGPLAPLAWLEGCWQGNVNERAFREQWLPLRGGLLIGAGQTVLRGKVQDYQYMRIEPKSDGVYFSQFSGDRKETSFRLAGTNASASLEVVNVLGRRNLYDYRYLDGYAYAEPVTMLPFLPTFGLTVAF